MPLPAVFGFKPVACAVLVAIALSGCTASNSFVQNRTQGYEIPDAALQQIRPGQSQDLVRTVLGSPQTTSAFSGGTAWYYVETRVRRTSFGANFIDSRTVLAVYFDTNGRVSERAIYGLQDGVAVNIETRRTPSFGEDRTFIESILNSVGL